MHASYHTLSADITASDICSKPRLLLLKLKDRCPLGFSPSKQSSTGGWDVRSETNIIQYGGKPHSPRACD